MPHKLTSRRTSKGMGSVRKRTVKRKDGSERTYWEGRITKGFDPKTGKPHTITVTANTQKEVMQRLQQKAVELNEGTYVAPSKLTLGEWLDIWMKEYQGSIKPMTRQNYNQLIKKHILPALGPVPLKKLTNLSIQRFYNSLELSPKSVKNIHGILRRALEQAVLIGELKTNPSKNCVLPKMEHKEITPLEPEEITRFLQHLDGEAYKNLFITAFFTGMRQGELIGLSWDNVDFDTGTITIKQQLQCLNGQYFMQSPKHDKIRIIAPAEIVMDALREEREKQEANRKLVGSAWSNKWNLVFTDVLGKNLVRRTVGKHYKRVLEESNIEHHRFHDTRHTFAVSMLDAGEDFKTLQTNLGHSSAAFTLNQYGHVSRKMMMQTSRKMNDYFSKLLPDQSPKKTS